MVNITNEHVTGWLDSLSINERSKKVYGIQVNKYLKNYGNDITPDTIRTFLIDGSVTGRVYVRKSAIKSLIMWLSKAVILQWTDYQPMFEKGSQNVKYGVKDRRYMQTLTYDQVVFLTNSLNNMKLRIIVMVSFDTGARVAAILKLKAKDIKIVANEIMIDLNEKGDKYIQRTITKQTYEHLNGYFKESVFKYPLLDANKMSDKLVEDVYYHLWSELKNNSRDILGYAVSFHWIRRAAGNYWYSKLGNDIVAAKEFLGHEDTKTTAKYLKIQGQKVKDEMKKETRDW